MVDRLIQSQFYPVTFSAEFLDYMIHAVHRAASRSLLNLQTQALHFPGAEGNCGSFEPMGG
jgi:hypothetical protein